MRLKNVCRCDAFSCLVAGSLLWLLMASWGADPVDAAEPARAAPWPATDALGRALPVAGDRGVPAPRPGRYVGLFYFLWHNDARGKAAGRERSL